MNGHVRSHEKDQYPCPIRDKIIWNHQTIVFQKHSLMNKTVQIGNGCVDDRHEFVGQHIKDMERDNVVEFRRGSTEIVKYLGVSSQ